MILKEKWQHTDLWLRVEDTESFFTQLEQFEAERFYKNGQLQNQGYQHAIRVVGEEPDQDAVLNEDGEVVTPQTFTGKWLINLRFHRQGCEELATAFQAHDWQGVEFLPKPQNPINIFGE